MTPAFWVSIQSRWWKSLSCCAPWRMLVRLGSALLSTLWMGQLWKGQSRAASFWTPLKRRPCWRRYLLVNCLFNNNWLFQWLVFLGGHQPFTNPSQVGSVPTFGARLNMAKVRSSTNFKICWRVKFFAWFGSFYVSPLFRHRIQLDKLMQQRSHWFGVGLSESGLYQASHWWPHWW